MSFSPLVMTNFLLLGGPDSTVNPVANGSISVRLNKDAMSPNGLVSTQIDEIDLDDTGAPVGAPLFWPNSSLSPSNTVYNLKVFNATGEQILYGNSLATTVGPSSGAVGFGSSFGSSFGS